MILLLISLHGVFVIRWEITQPASVDSIIQKCLNNHLDAIVVQVYARAEALVQNPYFPRFEELRTRKDLLRLLIEKAERRNIQVWGWVNLFYAWSQTDFPRGKGHITETHPEWFVVDRSGKKNIGMNVEELKRRGLEGYFVSPFADEYIKNVRNYLIYLQSRYRLKGFVLDYIRYPGRFYSHEPLVDSYIERKLYIDRDDPLLPLIGLDYNNIKEDMKRKRFVEVIQLLRNGVSLPVMACVYQNLERARGEFYQDWTLWIKEGVVDAVVPMIYTRSNRVFEKRIRALKKYPIVPAIGAYLFRGKGWRNQISILRRYGVDSYIIFSIRHI